MRAQEAPSATASSDPNAILESPYGAELRRGVGDRYSRPDIEVEYTRMRLDDAALLIRLTAALIMLATVLRFLEQSINGTWNRFLPEEFGFTVAVSAALAIISWSPGYHRLYLPVARVVIPIRNAVMAIPVAGAAAHGHAELLMVLPLFIVGPFFFAGLPAGAALNAALFGVVSYAASAFFFHLDTALALRTGIFMLMSVPLCAIAVRKMEKKARTSFLESKLLAELAQIDPLTGTRNRRVLEEHLARVWRQAIDDKRNLAALLIDVDYFKPYNDEYGHQAGDQALRRIAHALQGLVTRPLDILARYGGEEFVVILHDVDASKAHEMAERMRRGISALGIEHRTSRICATVTISIGVAVVAPIWQRQHRGVLQLADQALYKAKSEGRNRVELMDETEYEMMITGIFSSGQIGHRLSASGPDHLIGP
ncbi:MAG: GGDEF domain-containing protein [Steroidobacteraceae bacterium]